MLIMEVLVRCAQQSLTYFQENEPRKVQATSHLHVTQCPTYSVLHDRLTNRFTIIIMTKAITEHVFLCITYYTIQHHETTDTNEKQTFANTNS